MATMPNIFGNLNPSSLPLVGGYPAVNLALFDQNFADMISPVNFTTGVMAQGTNQTPIGSTIPTNSQGNQFMSLAITPKLATSILQIDVLALLSHTFLGTAVMTVALFQGTNPNAIACMCKTMLVPNVPEPIGFRWYQISGTTAATTFYVYAGMNQIGSVTFNGYVTGGVATQLFGGVLASSITITEIAA